MFHLINFIVGLSHFSGLNKIKCGSVVLSLFLSPFWGLMIIYLLLCFHLGLVVNSIKCKITMKGSYCLIEYLILLRPWKMRECICKDKMVTSSASILSFWPTRNFITLRLHSVVEFRLVIIFEVSHISGGIYSTGTQIRGSFA